MFVNKRASKKSSVETCKIIILFKFYKNDFFLKRAYSHRECLLYTRYYNIGRIRFTRTQGDSVKLRTI